MLISSRFSKVKKFLFLHIYKTAGSSVRRALFPYASKSQILIQLINHALIINRSPIRFRRNIYIYHPTALDLINEFGREKYNEFFSFSFSRNPLSQQLSLFKYVREKRQMNQHTDLRKFDFDDFLNWRINYDIDLQSKYTHASGKKLINYIAKYESIDMELKIIANKLGIPQLKLPYSNKSKKLKKEIRISKKTFNKFVDTYYKDYELLNYNVDDLPIEITIN